MNTIQHLNINTMDTNGTLETLRTFKSNSIKIVTFHDICIINTHFRKRLVIFRFSGLVATPEF